MTESIQSRGKWAMLKMCGPKMGELKVHSWPGWPSTLPNFPGLSPLQKRPSTCFAVSTQYHAAVVKCFVTVFVS